MGTNGTPERLTRVEREARDDRIVEYHVRNGLSVTQIAPVEGVHKSTVSRALRRTHERWRTERLDIPATLRGSLERLQAVSDDAMYEASVERKDRRAKMLCLRTAVVAEGFKHRLLMMLGIIGPDALPAGHDPEHATASDIRRLADEINRMGVRALPPSDDDLISDGEREWLEGRVVEPDEPPVIDVPAAPTPTFEPAGRTAAQPGTRVESTANAMTAGSSNGRRDRLTALQRVTPPGER